MKTRRAIGRLCLLGAGAMLLACAGLGTFPHAAEAQSWPSKPIKLIVPWPPGGGVDTAARMISQPLSEKLGQPIVVENRPGAAGNIGTALAAREKPDGYTLLLGSLSPNAVNPHLYTNLGFDPVKDRPKLDPYCPVRNVTPDYPPTMLVHGTADTDVPYELSAAMAKELTRHKVAHELVRVDGAGHGLTPGDKKRADEAHEKALAFIRRHLKSEGGLK